MVSRAGHGGRCEASARVDLSLDLGQDVLRRLLPVELAEERLERGVRGLPVRVGARVELRVGQIESDNPELEYSIHPIPTEDGAPFTLGVADHLMAFQNDGDKQEAITAFFDYFYTADVYVPWVQAEGFLPTTLSGSEQLAGEEALAPFLEVLPDAQFSPSTNPGWATADSAFKALFGQLDGKKSAQDVLTEIQEQVDAG